MGSSTNLKIVQDPARRRRSMHTVDMLTHTTTIRKPSHLHYTLRVFKVANVDTYKIPSTLFSFLLYFFLS